MQWVEGTVSGVNLNNVTIAGTGTFALQEQTGGTATITNVVATGVAQNPPSYSCEGGNFVITDGGGNSGYHADRSAVPTNPTPVFPPYPATGVTVTPERAELRLGRHRRHQLRADRDGLQPDRLGRVRLVDRGRPATSRRPTRAARRSRRTARARSASRSTRPRPVRVPAR